MSTVKSLEIQSYFKNNSCEFCLLGALLPEPGGNHSWTRRHPIGPISLLVGGYVLWQQALPKNLLVNGLVSLFHRRAIAPCGIAQMSSADAERIERACAPSRWTAVQRFVMICVHARVTGVSGVLGVSVKRSPRGQFAKHCKTPEHVMQLQPCGIVGTEGVLRSRSQLSLSTSAIVSPCNLVNTPVPVASRDALGSDTDELSELTLFSALPQKYKNNTEVSSHRPPTDPPIHSLNHPATQSPTHSPSHP